MRGGKVAQQIRFLPCYAARLSSAARSARARAAWVCREESSAQHGAPLKSHCKNNNGGRLKHTLNTRQMVERRGWQGREPKGRRQTKVTNIVKSEKRGDVFKKKLSRLTPLLLYSRSPFLDFLGGPPPDVLDLGRVTCSALNLRSNLSRGHRAPRLVRFARHLQTH